MECRHTFNTIVYSSTRRSSTKYLSARRRLALHLRFNMNLEYSKMCRFVQARMSLEIVISNSLVLQGAQDKEAWIYQKPDLTDGAAMAQIMPWRG